MAGERQREEGKKGLGAEGIPGAARDSQAGKAIEGQQEVHRVDQGQENSQYPH